MKVFEGGHRLSALQMLNHLGIIDLDTQILTTTIEGPEDLSMCYMLFSTSISNKEYDLCNEMISQSGLNTTNFFNYHNAKTLTYNNQQYYLIESNSMHEFMRGYNIMLRDRYVDNSLFDKELCLDSIKFSYANNMKKTEAMLKIDSLLNTIQNAYPNLDN